jgi:hypothetical protein
MFEKVLTTSMPEKVEFTEIKAAGETMSVARHIVHVRD